MPTVNEINATSVADLQNAIPTKWDVEVRADTDKFTFWGPNFEGSEGSGKPIIRKDDFTVEPMDTIKINTMQALAQTGVTAATTLKGTEEKMVLGQFSVVPDWFRHAVGFDRRASRRIVFDAAKATQRMLAKWAAKKIDDDLEKLAIVTTTAEAILQGGNVAAVGSLGSTNVMKPDEIGRVRLKLQSLGALPFDVMMDNGQERPFYGLLISEVSEYQLWSDPTFFQAQRDGGVRGEKNKIWTGALGMWRGVIIYVQPTVQASHKKWGNYLKPEARLNGAITATSTAAIAVGGSNANINYTEYFPTTGNLIFIDGAGTAPEIVAYTGVTNSTFTGITRAAQGTTGVAHSDAALMALASNSVERERALGFGAEFAVRGWALLPTNQNDFDDFRFKFGIGIEFSMAHAIVTDSASTIPNYVLLNVAASRP